MNLNIFSEHVCLNDKQIITYLHEIYITILLKI